MSAELAWQSKETEKLLGKNDKLVAVNQRLRRELSIYEQTLKDLSTKVHGYQKTITALLSRLNTSDASQRAQLQTFEYEEAERQREKAEDQQQIEALEEHVRCLRSQVAATQQQVHTAAAKSEEAEAKHRMLLAFQNDAVKFILRCLEDVSGVHNESAPRGGIAPSTLATLETSDRSRVMQYMADQLLAYRHQIRELELQKQWQSHSAEGALGTTAGLPIGATAGLPPIMTRSQEGTPPSPHVRPGRIPPSRNLTKPDGPL